MKKPLKINSRIVYENKYISVKVDTLKLGKITWEQVYFTKPNYVFRNEMHHFDKIGG